MDFLSGYEKSSNTILDDLLDKYVQDDRIMPSNGMDDKSISRLNQGDKYRSILNKRFLIKLIGVNPDDSQNYQNERFKPKNFTDLCKMTHNGAQMYDVEDFLYCRNINYPINRLITLRRFVKPVTDNIYDNFVQEETDIARMVTFFDNNNNKLEDILSFTYGLNWREMTAEFETASMEGDQSGFSGSMKSIMSIIDPKLAQNSLRGQNKLNYDPKSDGNKIFGPVDSISKTHYRDVGLEFEKTFDLVFEYDLRSINGITPEFALKDVLANVLATTFNDAKFWGGTRYYVGERPSQYIKEFNWMNPDEVDNFFQKGWDSLKSFYSGLLKKAGGSKIQMVKNILMNGLAIGIGKMLDKVGRPSIPVMNSLLSGEPTGNWHVTIGNPDNPIMCIGNLLLDNVEVSFPTDSLGYGDFPTKLKVTVKLKAGMPKDRAGIEMMFNHGRSRMYFQPEVVYSGRKGVKSNGTIQSFERDVVDLSVNAGINIGNNVYSFMVNTPRVEDYETKKIVSAAKSFDYKEPIKWADNIVKESSKSIQNAQSKQDKRVAEVKQKANNVDKKQLAQNTNKQQKNVKKV
jgi:hypothetical protein